MWRSGRIRNQIRNRNRNPEPKSGARPRTTRPLRGSVSQNDKHEKRVDIVWPSKIRSISFRRADSGEDSKSTSFCKPTCTQAPGRKCFRTWTQNRTLFVLFTTITSHMSSVNDDLLQAIAEIDPIDRMLSHSRVPNTFNLQPQTLDRSRVAYIIVPG